MKWLKTHKQGKHELVSQVRSWTGSPLTAVLLLSAWTPDRETHNTWGDVKTHECGNADYTRRTVEDRTVTLEGVNTVHTHSKLNFTADNTGGKGSVTARYVVYVFGVPGSLTDTSVILGHVDLTGGGDVSSVDAEFSFTPATAANDGLIYAPQSVEATA